MIRILDKIEITNEIKVDSYQNEEGDFINYNYIDVYLYDKDNTLLETWKFVNDEIPTEAEFCERTGCKIGVSAWSN
jgi:hypothetical protein